MTNDKERKVNAEQRHSLALTIFKTLTGSTYGCKIPGAENRGVTIKQLDDVLEQVARRCVPEGWVDMLTGKPLTPEKVNLYHVVEYIVLPLTVRRNCSYVELVAKGPQVPEWFVSHWWGEPVVDFIKCLKGHATDHKLSHDIPYWVCAYANNQWDLNDINKELKDTPFFTVLQSPQCKGTVSILDQKGVVFTRIWCGYELFVSLRPANDGKGFKWCVYTTGENGGAVGLIEGNAPNDMSPSSKWNRETHFPAILLKDSLKIDIETAVASVEKDKYRILKNIGDATPLHSVLKGRFAAAGLRIVLEIEHNEDMWYELLKKLEDGQAKVLNLDFSGSKSFTEQRRTELKNNIPWETLEILA